MRSCTRTVLAVFGVIAQFVMATNSIKAHEFWISPERGQLAVGDVMRADLKVGIMLKGEPYPYLSRYIQAFRITLDGQSTDVEGNDGDLPALNQPVKTPGLHVISHHTTAFTTSYDEWALFRRYLSEEGLDRFEELHLARGLPRSGFTEAYTRCAKALVQVGPFRPGDDDFRTGLPIELVAESNPYEKEWSHLTVRLLWMGEPVAGHQVSVFHRAKSVTRIEIFTDPNGKARLPQLGPGEYLLNAVILEPVEDDATVVWESFWASLSFRIS